MERVERRVGRPGVRPADDRDAEGVELAGDPATGFETLDRARVGGIVGARRSVSGRGAKGPGSGRHDGDARIPDLEGEVPVEAHAAAGLKERSVLDRVDARRERAPHPGGGMAVGGHARAPFARHLDGRADDRRGQLGVGRAACRASTRRPST